MQGVIIFSTHVLNYFWGNYAIFCIKLTAFFIKVSAQPIAEKKLSGLRFSNNILLIIHVNMLPKLLKFIPAKNTYVHVNLNSMECINVTCLTQSLYTGLYHMNDIKKTSTPFIPSFLILLSLNYSISNSYSKFI